MPQSPADRATSCKEGQSKSNQIGSGHRRREVREMAATSSGSGSKPAAWGSTEGGGGQQWLSQSLQERLDRWRLGGTRGAEQVAH